MAISQSKYIRIGSNVNTTALGSRDFSGLVFTKSAMQSTAPSKTKTAYETNGDVVGLSSLADVGMCFGTESDEYKFAEKYFGYVSRDGSCAMTLNFKKMGDSETPSAAISGVQSVTNNFGSFTFLGEFTDEQLAAAAGVNSGFDHRYLFCVGKEFEDTAKASATMAKFADAVGTFVYFGADAFGAAIPMAMLGAINFNRSNSTICFMFKQIANETAVITNDTDYDSMKGINANFYGLTQTNGKTFAFLQCGFCSNGEDAGTYCNEIWLKSAIATSFMNLCLRVNKVPADATGSAMIRAAIVGDVKKALDNGTILVGKPLTEEDIAEVYRLTNNEDAYLDVQNDGYWLDVVIEKVENEWIAKYYLVYAKADGIRFCDGSHVLV